MGRFSEVVSRLFSKRSIPDSETVEAATVRGLLLSAFNSNRSMFDSFKTSDARIEGIDPNGNAIEPRSLEMADLDSYIRNWTLLDLGYPHLGFWFLSWKQGTSYHLMEFAVEGTKAANLNVRPGHPWPWDFPGNVDDIRFPNFVIRD